MQILGPCPFSDSINLVWGSGLCILTETPGDYETGGSWTTV